MPKSRFRLLAAAAILACSTPILAAQAHAAGNYASRTPLMVIRFSERNVYFEKPLYTVITKAVAAKENVMFDVVGMRPVGTSQNANLGRVTTAMKRMGVPESRMNVESGESAGVSAEEVHIFVR